MQIFLSGFLNDANDANATIYKHGLLQIFYRFRFFSAAFLRMWPAGSYPSGCAEPEGRGWA
jgi:hypothetical protein